MKTKQIKQIGAAIMVIIMLLSLNLSGVLAFTDASGRDHDRDVSLTIYKFASNKALSFPTSNGTEIDPSDIPAESKAVPGVVFKIENVTQKTGTDGSNNPDDYEPVTGGSVFSTVGTTDAAGKVVFSTASGTLPGQGIYKVTEVKSATAGTTAVADFIISLPMANPSIDEGADPWLYDVYAYPKNDIKNTIDKEVDKDKSIGNIISWKYSVMIPHDIENPPTGKESLVITDRLDYRLSYVTDSIKGTFTTKGSSTENNFDFGSDYTLDVGDGTDGEGKPIQVLTITITGNGFAKLAAALSESGNETPMLYFSFDTRTRNIDSVNPDFDTVYNGGELDYTNSADQKYDTEKIEDPDKPEIDVYGIKIYKINVNAEILAGASFKIYTSEADAKSDRNALISPNGTDAWTVTTVTDGYAYFYGLVEGTYYLIETQAPEGYNKIKNPIMVEASTITADVDHTVQITVTNNKGFELPITGGIGTIMFTAGGLLLIGIAVALLLFTKKKKTTV